MRTRWLGAIATLLLSLASLLGTSGAAQPAEGGFSAAERRQLLRGELVRRPTQTSDGRFRYIGGTSFQRVPAPQAEVWAAVQDVARYPSLLPGLEEARVIETRGDERVLYMRHAYSFVSASYYARVRVEAAQHTIHFELDPSRPHDVRAGRGFITVDPYRGESIVSWGVRADVGQGLISGVFAPVIHDWILRVPECVRGHVAGHDVC